MNIDLDAIFKAPFQQKDWMRRLSIPYAMNLLYIIIYGLTQILPILIPSYSTSSSSIYGSSYSYNGIGIVIFLGLIGLSIVLSLVYTFYTSGYSLTSTENVVDGDEKEYLPEPTAWGKIFGNGAKFFVVNLVYALVIIAVVILAFIVLGLFASASSSSRGLYLGDYSSMWSGGAFYTICCCGIYGLIFAVSILYSGFLIPASTYLLVTNKSVGDALNPAKVFNVVKKAFPQLLLLLGLNLLLGIIMGFLMLASLITFCFVIVIIPAIMTLQMAYTSYIMGVVFKEIKSKKL